MAYSVWFLVSIYMPQAISHMPCRARAVHLKLFERSDKWQRKLFSEINLVSNASGSDPV
jgi:hypothetical protein